MKELEFSWKYKNYEFRACPKRLARLFDDDVNETIDFIKWEADNDGNLHCFSLAYWIRSGEGYYLKCVGSRPFEYIDNDDVLVVWQGMRAAQNALDLYFQMTDE